jgi:hypothetical protein
VVSTTGRLMPLYVFCALSDHAIYTETEDTVSAHPAISLENGVDFVHLVCNTSPSQTQKKNIVRIYHGGKEIDG